MAAQRTRARRSSHAGNGRRASEKVKKYRFAQNVGGKGTVAEREYEAYALVGDDDPRGDPDVLLDIPVVKVDAIHLELDDLDAHVALQAKVLDLVRLNVGVDVHLGKLRIDIKGVEAQALLKVRLDHVTAIVDRVLTTLDRNPELVKSLSRTVEHVGEGAGHALGETGEAVESVGEGAEGAVREVGSGAGEAVGEIGEGAGQAVGDVGEGAGQAVGDVGQGAGQAVGDVGEGAGQAVGDVGEGVGQALGELEGIVGGVLQGGGDSGGIGGARAAQIAKLAARVVVHELRTAAADEAKELGLAATRKAIEVGERRKQRKAEEHNATQAAMRVARDLGVELERIEGSGPEGRITIRDVREAQEA
jgi:e3 binding domain